ncbi:hypothetical protein MMC20_006962 [Loxospora ochrophaea]|nr:hypothetical protein [Loxospora ochrophaea]
MSYSAKRRRISEADVLFPVPSHLPKRPKPSAIPIVPNLNDTNSNISFPAQLTSSSSAQSPSPTSASDVLQPSSSSTSIVSVTSDLSTDSSSDSGSDLDIEPEPRSELDESDSLSSTSSSSASSSSPSLSPSLPREPHSLCAIRSSTTVQDTNGITSLAPPLASTLSSTKNQLSLRSRLSSFLPSLRAANKELEIERERGTLGERDIENVGEEGRGGYIEMDLGLGVLEDKGTETSEESDDESESENEVLEGDEQKIIREKNVLGRLMGVQRREKPKIELVGDG